MIITYETDLNAEVYVTSDIAGETLVAGTFIASAGVVTFSVEAGTYYIWTTKLGYSYTTPLLLTATVTATITNYGTALASPSTPREMSQAYGPKRVKTPNMEVEQFDPMTIIRAQERENAVAPPFPWGMTIASPNRCKYK